MLLQNEHCRIHSLGSSEEGISFSEFPYGELQNLTETHLYQYNMPSELIFSIESEGETAGEISLKSLRWFNRKAEIAVFILKEFRGKGLAEQALRLLLDYVFNTMNFHRLEAEVVAYNPAAKALFEKIGFVQEGILREAKFFKGRYHDIFSYGLLAKEWKR